MYFFLKWLQRYIKFSFFLIFNSVDLFCINILWTFLRRQPCARNSNLLKFLWYSIYNCLGNITKNVFGFLTVRHYSAWLFSENTTFRDTDLKWVLYMMNCFCFLLYTAERQGSPLLNLQMYLYKSKLVRNS